MEPRTVVVVSGLPRSGTSLAMQMLHAGGLQPLTVNLRTPDADNPRGYFEFERVKQLKTDKTWLADAGGKVVKIVHLLLMELPEDRPYKVVFMNRNLDEVVRSQATMLERNARAGAQLLPDRLKAIYAQQLATVSAWLAARPNFEVLRVEHQALLANPEGEASRIAAFIGTLPEGSRAMPEGSRAMSEGSPALPDSSSGGGSTLDVSAMARAVDPKLHRNKSVGNS